MNNDHFSLSEKSTATWYWYLTENSSVICCLRSSPLHISRFLTLWMQSWSVLLRNRIVLAVDGPDTLTIPLCSEIVLSALVLCTILSIALQDLASSISFRNSPKALFQTSLPSWKSLSIHLLTISRPSMSALILSSRVVPSSTVIFSRPSTSTL